MENLLFEDGVPIENRDFLSNVMLVNSGNFQGCISLNGTLKFLQNFTLLN